MAKGPNAFRTISEAAEELGVPQHVLRFWETKFSFIRPMKRAGGRRFYRPQDIAVLAVPGDVAQDVLDLIVAAGVRAVLNFSPGGLRVPETVKLKHVDLTVSLEGLSFFLAHGGDDGA